MNTIAIVMEIDAEISRLQQARELLAAAEAAGKRKPGRPALASLQTNGKPARVLSAASRESIAAAQKKRWAKVRRAKKAALKAAATEPAAKKSSKAAAKKTSAKTGVTKKAAPAKKAVAAKKNSLPKQTGEATAE
jgi:hypothetical protein